MRDYMMLVRPGLKPGWVGIVGPFRNALHSRTWARRWLTDTRGERWCAPLELEPGFEVSVASPDDIVLHIYNEELPGKEPTNG